jgi:hypothetical protein
LRSESAFPSVSPLREQGITPAGTLPGTKRSPFFSGRDWSNLETTGTHPKKCYVVITEVWALNAAEQSKSISEKAFVRVTPVNPGGEHAGTCR